VGRTATTSHSSSWTLARYERLLGGGPTLLDQIGSIVGIVGLTVRRIRHQPRWIVRIKIHERGNPKVAKKITRPYPTKEAAAQAMVALSIDVKEIGCAALTQSQAS
jgi:hypothetical protein